MPAMVPQLPEPNAVPLADLQKNVQAAMTLWGQTILGSQNLGLGGHQESEIVAPHALDDPFGLGDQRTKNMPMTNFHAARVYDPAAYDHQVLGQKEITPGVYTLFAKLKGEENSKVVSYHFDTKHFTEDQAKKWMKDHAADKRFTFEPAKKEEIERAEHPPGDLHIRSFSVSPETWDEEKGRVRGVIATDAAVFSTDLKTGKPVHEVWQIDGIMPDKHVPLLDNHKRDSVRNILGSIRDTSPLDDHNYHGWIHVSEAEPEIRTKVREGHVKELSAGMQPLETTTIPPGKTMTVRGRTYTARTDQPLHVHTALLLREVSLPVKGADSNTQIRSQTSIYKENVEMTKHLRKLCERMGMRKDHTDTEAEEWLSKRSEEDRGALAKWAKEEEEEEAHKRSESEEAEKKAAKEKKDKEDEETRKRAATTAITPESIRREVDAALLKRETDELSRQDSIRKAADGIRKSDEKLADELVRKAIDDKLPLDKVPEMFLDAIRNRTTSAGPSIQSHGHDKDLTAEVLATALVIRSLDNLGSDSTGASHRSDPVNLIGRYAPDQFNQQGVGNWVGRNPTDALSDEQKKRNYQLLNMAEKFRHLSLPDMMVECCRLDGKPVSGYPSRSEVVRAGLSGGAFGAIFTTNFNALFLAGYLEAADTTVGWVTEGDAPNFMMGELATIGKMGNLTLAGKAAADQLTYGDWNEKITVRRLSGAFEVDEQDLINDRFGAIQTNSPQEMGLVARRVRPNAIYSMLLGNYSAGTGRGPTLNQDGQQLFCAAHGNFLAAASNDIYGGTGSTDSSNGTSTPAAGSVGVSGLQKAIPAIQKQRLNGVPLNLIPRFILTAPDLDMAVRIAFFSTQRIVASGSGGTANPLEQLNLAMRSDARMDETGSVDPFQQNLKVAGLKYHYILACRPGEEGAKTVHVNYLQGSGRAPQIRSYTLQGPGAPGRWGIGWDIKLDIGIAAADYRGLYYAESSY